jgi:hypothetical protein
MYARKASCFTLGLVAISYDPPATLKKFADARGISFPPGM